MVRWDNSTNFSRVIGNSVTSSVKFTFNTYSNITQWSIVGITNIQADIDIKALGFDAEDLPNLFDWIDLQVTKWGTLKIDFDTMESNLPGVFAAGDIVRGASLVVWAIRDGRDVAESIRTFLEKKESKVEKVA